MNRLLQALAVPIGAQRERSRRQPVNEPQTVGRNIMELAAVEESDPAWQRDADHPQQAATAGTADSGTQVGVCCG